MPVNVGTYIDAPFHRFADREDISRVSLDRLVGIEGVVVDATEEESRALNPKLPTERLAATAVLFRTGWDSRWDTEAYWEPGPYLSQDLARRLIESDAGLVGVDFWNVDDTTTRRRPVHTELLRAGILIVVHVAI